MGSPTVMVNGNVVQLPGQMQSLTLAPLTPPAHELEQPHPLYGQPHIQVQHGVLVKAPPGTAAHLTTLSHPGTPPDTPPISTSPPPPLQLHRGDPRDPRDARDPRDRGGILLQLQQPATLVHEEMQVGAGGMGWLTQSLRQEPLDLRPHCPPEQTSEPGHHEPWSATPTHHHFQELQHLPRPTRHTGESILVRRADLRTRCARYRDIARSDDRSSPDPEEGAFDRSPDPLSPLRLPLPTRHAAPL